MHPIYGIAGPSCSGKTTLARALADRVKGRVLHLDMFWRSGAPRPTVAGHESFERPDQYDGEALLKAALHAAEAEPVVAEGFLLFAYPGMFEACDAAFFLDVPHEELVRRRLARGDEASGDVAGEGRVPEADLGWHAHGREEWERFGASQATIPGIHVLRPTQNAGNKPAWADSTVDSIMRIVRSAPISGGTA